MRAAARRLTLLVGSTVLVTGLVGGGVGAALGSGFVRSAAVGMYVVGCFLIVLGLFAGLRGPLRPKGGDEDREPLGSLFGYGLSAAGIRTATADEQADAKATTWLFFVVGAALILAGVLIDPQSSLY